MFLGMGLWGGQEASQQAGEGRGGDDVARQAHGVLLWLRAGTLPGHAHQGLLGGGELVFGFDDPGSEIENNLSISGSEDG